MPGYILKKFKFNIFNSIVLAVAAAEPETKYPETKYVTNINAANLLPSSLQQALSQHHKAILNNPQQSLQRIEQQSLQSLQRIQQPVPSYQQVQQHLYAQHPQQHVRQLSEVRQPQQQQQHQQPQLNPRDVGLNPHHLTQDLTGQSHLASAASEFYQHYAANIANFNQMYKQN